MAQTFDPEEILQLPLMANLATASRDGPRNAPVWFIWEDGALWLLGSKEGSSVERLQDDARCAVEIVHYDNAEGILLHLGLRGEASVEASSSSRFKRLLSKYLGEDESSWNNWFVENIARIDDPSGRMIKLVPTSIFTNNVSYFRTGPDMAWPKRL
ncbi:MAG: pyridoxamine 5'-phosphate oxidase [Rhizobiaceae bacterium]|nr:pyridoxamine 5'-phosphate oxidase [Rhizobiaceae bacterium]